MTSQFRVLAAQCAGLDCAKQSRRHLALAIGTGRQRARTCRRSRPTRRANSRRSNVGAYVLRSHLHVKAYAEIFGRAREPVRNEVYADEVDAVASVWPGPVQLFRRTHLDRRCGNCCADQCQRK
jgi:hypothetical protein